MPKYSDWGIANELIPMNVGGAMPSEERTAISDGQFIKVTFSKLPLFGLIARKIYKDAGLVSNKERKEAKEEASHLASSIIGEMFSLLSTYAVMRTEDRYSDEIPCLILPRSQRCISAISEGQARMEGRLEGLASKPEKWVKVAVNVEDIDLSHDALVCVFMSAVYCGNNFVPGLVPNDENVFDVVKHLGLSSDDDPFVQKICEFVRLSGELVDEKKRRFY